FEERGKRRIHKKPKDSELNACRPWLQAEVELLKPALIVCLGASAVFSVLGRDYKLTKERGKMAQHGWAPHVMATIHPSAILRSPTREDRRLAYAGFVEDLKKAGALLKRF